MSDERLCWTPATELAALIRKKKVSPVEVLDAVLDRIERLNPKLNAFVTLTDEQARREAKAAECALSKKGARGGPRPAPRRHRRRRLDPHPRVVRGNLRPQGLVRAHSRVPAERRVEPLAHRSDDAHRRRRRAHAAGRGGAGRTRPDLAAGGARGLREGARWRCEGPARRVERGPGLRRRRGPGGTRSLCEG